MSIRNQTILMANYKPGICNIGRNEIRIRYLTSIIGFSAFFIFFAISKFTNTQPSFPLYFIASLTGFEGFFQGYFRFCATFALLGVYDFSGSSKEKGKVIGKEERIKDLWQMLRIHIYSLIASLSLSLIVFYF